MDPWSKGDYSLHIREALMVVEKLPEINPPSVRVQGQVLLAIPILEGGWTPSGTPFGRLESSEMLIFFIFFMEFSGHCKYGCKPAMHKHQQTETGTGCTELVG